MVKDTETTTADVLKRYGFQAADEKPGQQHFNLQGSKFDVAEAPSRSGLFIAGTAKENLPEVLRVKPTDTLSDLAQPRIVLPKTAEKPPEFEILLSNLAQADEISAGNLPNPAVSRISLHDAMAAALQGSQQINRERERLSQLDQLQANSLNFYIVKLESLSAQTRNPELLILASELRRRSTIADLEQVLRANLKQHNLDFVAQVAEEHQADLVSQATLKPRARKEEIQAKTREFGQNLSQITIFDALNAYFDQMAVSNNQSRNPERMKKLVKKAQAELHRSKQNIDQVILSIFLDYYQLLRQRKSIGHLSQETMEMAIIAATETQTDLASVLASQETILPMAMDLIQEHWHTSRPQTQWHPIANKITGADTQIGLVFSTLKRFGSKSELVDTKWWELVTVSEIKDKQLMANMALYLWQNNQTERPIFFQLMVKLSQVYPDCQVLREHQASRDQVLEILTTHQPQWLVEHLDDLLKLTHKLVCLPSSTTDRLMVGFDLEFGEKAKKFKRLPEFPTEYLEPETGQELHEVRRRFKNIQFDAAYMASLTDLSLWLKQVSHALLSVHYHFDQKQQNNGLGTSMYGLYWQMEKSHVELGKETFSLENRGVVAPTDSEFLDPKTMSAELAFFATSGFKPRREWHALTWPDKKPLSWKEAVWGQILRSSDDPSVILNGLIALQNNESLNGDVKLEALLDAFSISALTNLVDYGDKSFARPNKNANFERDEKLRIGVKQFLKQLRKLKPDQALPNKWSNYLILAEAPIPQEKLLKFLHRRNLDLNIDMLTALYQATADPEQFFDVIYDLRSSPNIDDLFDLDLNIISWLCRDEKFVDRLNQRLWQDVQKFGITGVEVDLLFRVKKLSKRLQKYIIAKYQAHEAEEGYCREIILHRTDWPLSFKVGLIRTSSPEQLRRIFVYEDLWLKDTSIIINQWLTRIEATTDTDDKLHIITTGLYFLKSNNSSLKLSSEVSKKLSDFFTSLLIGQEYPSLISMVIARSVIDPVFKLFYSYENFCQVYLALAKGGSYVQREFLTQLTSQFRKLPQDFYLKLCLSENAKIQFAGLDLLFAGAANLGFKLKNEDLLAREEVLSNLILKKEEQLFRVIIDYLVPTYHFRAKNLVIRPATILKLAKQKGGDDGDRLVLRAAKILDMQNLVGSRYRKSLPKDSLLRPTDLSPAQVDQLLALFNHENFFNENPAIVLEALRNTDLTSAQVENCLKNGQKDRRNAKYWLIELFKYRQPRLTPQQQIKVARIILAGKNDFEISERLLILKRQRTKLVPEAINLLAPLMTGENTQIALSLLTIIKLGPNVITPPISERLANLVLSQKYLTVILHQCFKGKNVTGIRSETLKKIQEHQDPDVFQFAKFFQVKN